MKKKNYALTLAMTIAFSAGMMITSLAGWKSQNGNWYYYNDSTGQMVRDDWVRSGDKWYYVDTNGVMKVNSLIDDTYYVNGNGEMVMNTWMYLEDKWYQDAGWRYFGNNGKAYANGWKQINEVWYHFSNSIMDTNWLEEDGKTYYLGKSGAMTTGWRLLADREDDWGEYWYYFGGNGKMYAGGEYTINGSVYVLDTHGRMKNGWVNTADYTSSTWGDLSTSKIDKLKYYKSGGQRASGWQYLTSPDEAEESWYYFRDGRAYSPEYKTTKIGKGYGMAKIKGDTYCFDSKGRMVTGLVEVDGGKKFYFNPENGKMMTGRVIVNDENHDNEVFYFTTTGSIGNKGDGITGVKDGCLYENGLLIRAEDGMRYEKVVVDGKEYVVNEQGKIKTSGTVTDADGVKYKITKRDDGTYKIEVL